MSVHWSLIRDITRSRGERHPHINKREEEMPQFQCFTRSCSGGRRRLRELFYRWICHTAWNAYPGPQCRRERRRIRRGISIFRQTLARGVVRWQMAARPFFNKGPFPSRRDVESLVTARYCITTREEWGTAQRSREIASFPWRGSPLKSHEQWWVHHGLISSLNVMLEI
jgi:hypothetical protein